MVFGIADTFTDSLGRLTADEQKAAKTTAFDLQVNPASPGLQFHRLDKARDKRFWSVRVSGDIRIIVHRDDASVLLCYVDHHDRAYDWAERRKLETHPRTGAAQIVEIRETVQEVVVPVYVQEERASGPGPAVLDGRSADELLAFGVPSEWVDDVRSADEATLLALVDRLPAEAAEAVLELATGGTPRLSVEVSGDPFEHPDAQRRFRILENVEELEHQMRRGIYIRANFDMEYEEYEITSGNIETFDREFMLYRRAQVLECNVRRSAFDNVNRIVGWDDQGYFVELIDGADYIGHRVKVVLQDIRRSYAVGDVILPGSGGTQPSQPGYQPPNPQCAAQAQSCKVTCANEQTTCNAHCDQGKMSETDRATCKLTCSGAGDTCRDDCRIKEANCKPATYK